MTNMMVMFSPNQNGPIDPLDVIRDMLLQCSSIDDAYRILQERQELLAK